MKNAYKMFIYTRKEKKLYEKIKVVQVTFRCFLFANIVFIHIY